jgi:hypothetical protein
MNPLGFIKPAVTVPLIVSIVAVLLTVFYGRSMATVMSFYLLQTPNIDAGTVFMLSSILYADLLLIRSPIITATHTHIHRRAFITTNIPHFIFSIILHYSGAAAQIWFLDCMTKLSTFWEGQLPQIDTSVEYYSLFSAMLIKFKVYFDLNLDLDQASSLLNSLPKHTLARSMNGVCYSDV